MGQDNGVPGIGPQRFQTAGDDDERRSVGAALGAAFLLLLLVAGVPTGLLYLGAAPAVPTALPGRDALTATIGVEQLLAVLVWVVWIAWLQFTVCVVVEMRSALSGVGLPARVPLAGPSQRLARTLVVTVLLLVTAAGQATAAVAPSMQMQGPAASPASVSAVQVPGAVVETPAQRVATGGAVGAAVAQVETTYWLGGMQLSPEEGAELEGHRVYVVQPPDGRYHDNLWDIAERTMGDGMRYKEVFELNKGRDQPDGQELTLERLIQPNWLLIMPEDATGVERVTAVVTPLADVQLPPAPSAPLDAPPVEAPPVAAGEAADVVAAPVAQDSIAPGLVGAGLLAAGLLVALERRRRRGNATDPSAGAQELEVVLRVGSDPQRALLLDRGLRRLAADLRTAGRPLPGVVVARVDDTSITLSLTPAAPAAPLPWRASEDGRTWTLDAADVDLGRTDAPAPYPGLVSVGRDDQGRDVLIDLEAAQGPVALVGDPATAAQVATALATELSTNRWSDALRVTGVELPGGLAAALPAERYAAARTAGSVLERLRSRRADTPGQDVLTGRLRSDGTQAWVPEYLVLGTVPAGDEARWVAELSTTTQRSPLGVVCVGDLPGARWQLEVRPDGRLVAPLLGIDVRSNRLTDRHVDALAELVATPPEAPTTIDERRAVLEHEGAVARPDVEVPARALGTDDLRRAPVQVMLLGEPRVLTRRPVEESRRALSTELVALLALHPEGVHLNVLAAALWPGGVTSEVRDRTVARAVTWLGEDARGRPHLVQGSDGRLALGPEVVVDWDVVRSLLGRARAADPRTERALLHEALELGVAPVVAVRPPGRYSWLARVRAERLSRDLLVDAVHRLVVLCWSDDDPSAAQAVAWEGVRLAPAAEIVWRDLLRATARTGGEPAVRDVVEVLVETLKQEGVGEMSAATRALVDELAPGRGPVITETA